jgi:hypothetical protein
MEVLRYINDVVYGMYTIEELINKKIAVHVPTKEKFNNMQDMLILLYGNKIKTLSYDKIGRYAKLMCINVESSTGPYQYDMVISYCDKQWYLDNGYTVISMDSIR